MTQYKTILFDLDGTITDPIEGITKSVAYAIKSFGDTPKEAKSYKDFIGPPLKDSFMKLGYKSEDVPILINNYRERFKTLGWKENVPYPEIETILSQLSKHYKLAVATSKPTFFAERILSLFNLDHHFELIMGSEMDGRRVAKSDVIEEVIKQLDLVVSETIMIGDRKHDLIGAKHHQMDCLGVLYGYGSKEELLKERPMDIIKLPKDLLEFFL